jgi:NAD(P)-dependent dehydrogenase (short-subunit alcohol dehydrogenase family)
MYLDRFNLKGRVAVVTGGGQGIGLACVEALLEAGAQVYIADRNAKAGAEGQAAMKAKGYVAEVIEMEVTDSKQVDAGAARVMKEKGRIDILVCNAGIARSETAAEDVTDEHWLNVIDVNLAFSGVVGRSAGTCWPPGAAQSSISARCRASSSTSRSHKPITTPPRPPCII